MKTLVFVGLLFISVPFAVPAQAPQTSDDSAKATVSQSDIAKTDPVPTASPDYVFPSAKTRFKWYVNGMFGPMSLGKSIGYAGLQTWRNSPEEWGDHWDGFGKRVASNVGKNIIKQTIVYGMDSALGVDSHYYRSKKTDFKSRLANALISPVTARNKEGHRVIGFSRLAGTYGSNMIADETWFPPRYTWKAAVVTGSTSLAYDALFNLFREFIWKK